MRDYRSRSDQFREAIRNSLQEIASRGDPITKRAVVDQAQFDNGKPVGKSTLYSRHSQSGELVHADLHREIDAARERQQRGKGRSTKRESIAALKREMSDLRAENRSLVDAIVSQEARLEEMNRKLTNETAVRSRADYELLVFAKTVDQLGDGAILTVTELVGRLEAKCEELGLLESAWQESEEYVRAVRNVRLVPLNRPSRV